MTTHASTWGFALGLALLGGGCGPTSLADDAGETTAMSGTGATESTDESTSETGEPLECGGFSLQASFTPPVVMFVVDASSSMLSVWDHDADPSTPSQTRWASARDVIGLVADGFHSVVSGVQRFPSADACPNASVDAPSCVDPSACVVASSPELELAERPDGVALLAALPGSNPEAVELAGASPAAAAYASALDHIVATQDPERYRGILLVTDGRTNCGPSVGSHDDALLGLVEGAYVEHQIETFVIAVDEAADPELEPGTDRIPGFDPRPALTALAYAGGRALDDPERPYLSASDLVQIEAMFRQAEPISSCEIDLTQTNAGPPAAEQVPLVEVTIDGDPLAYVELDQCDTSDGWTWLTYADLPVGQILMMCGSACDAMNDGALVEGVYGCPLPR